MSLSSKALAKVALATSHWDGWQNLLTGLGTSRDKRTAATFEISSKIPDSRLETLYNQDDMAARIVETVPDEALRKGFDVKIQDDDNPEDASKTEEDIQTELTALEVLEKFNEAHIWARLYGGSALLVGADDGAIIEQMTEPLDENRIKKITHLTVIEKQYLSVQKYYEDPREPKYGEPEVYSISPQVGGVTAGVQTFDVHESRMILFDGVRVSAQTRKSNNGWGNSVLQRVEDVLRDFSAGWDSVGHLLTDGSQAVFKLKGLIDMIASDDTTAVNQRMRIVDINRSVARALVVDADTEDFTRHSYNFGGVDKILQMFVLRLSAAARMPATILMGQSPAGENATGDADFQWFYSTIESVQKNYLTPKLNRVIELLLLAKEGPTKGVMPDSWNVVFAPLWQLTPEQEATMRKTVAEADKIYTEMGAVLVEEVTLSRFKPDGWSGETTVDLDLRREILEAEKDRELEKALNPPEPPVPPDLPVPPVPSTGDDVGNLGNLDHLDSDTVLQNAAKDHVSNGIKAGTITKPGACSSCKQTAKSEHIQAHHPDHTKPGKFTWLCTGCHKVAHDKRKKRG